MNIPLLRWFALSCAMLAGAIVGIACGGLAFLWTADGTHITIGMLALFVGVSIFIGRLTARRVNQLPLSNEQGAASPDPSGARLVEACWFASELEMGLGILVTVAGFLIAFSRGFRHLDLANANAARELIGQMASGLSTALVGTLTGIATSMLLKLQLVNLET